MIGLKNCTPKEFEYLYTRFNIRSDINLNIPTFYFSLMMEENVIGYVKLTFKDDEYHLEAIEYEDDMDRFNRFFIKCVAYKIFLKQKKKFYSKIKFEGIDGIESFGDNLYSYDVEKVLEQGKCCNGKQH